MKNVSNPIMLLLLLSFLLSSCGATRQISSSKSPSRTTSKIETSSENNLRTKVIDYARKQSGAKYRYGGEAPSGFDCSGLSCYVMKRFNKSIPRTSSEQAKTGRKIMVSKAKPGDLIFFGTKGKVTHVAIIVEQNKNVLKVIHSTSSRGVIIEDIYKSSYWKPKILFARNIISSQ